LERALPALRIPVDRLVLAKRRWRGIAEDGANSLRFDAPLGRSRRVFASDTGVYLIAQKYDPSRSRPSAPTLRRRALG